jgi:hypothetical protein
MTVFMGGLSGLGNKDERYQRILQAVPSLSPMEVDELFKILHKTKCEYSRNDNGIFINLRWVCEKVLRKIEQFMAFCTKNRVELEKYEKLRRIMTESFVVRQPRARMFGYGGYGGKHQATVAAAAAAAQVNPVVPVAPVNPVVPLVAAADDVDVEEAYTDVDEDPGAEPNTEVEVATEPLAAAPIPARTVAATGANTTMKFYLLKKRFAKVSGQSSRFEQGELLKE